MQTSELITEEYRQQQAELHEKHPEYGSASVHWAQTVANIINALEPKSVLDYGAGKGRLLRALRVNKPDAITFQMYEPADPDWATPPDPAELVCCIDVAEHVEPEFTEAFLDNLKRLTQRIAFITIHCGPAVKTLNDGRNAHLVQKPPGWWLPRLMSRFDLLEARATPGGFVFMGKARDAPKDH